MQLVYPRSSCCAPYCQHRRHSLVHRQVFNYFHPGLNLQYCGHLVVARKGDKKSPVLKLVSDAMAKVQQIVRQEESNDIATDDVNTFKDQLQKNPESLNMKVRLEVPGDGNCFFYSMVDQMKGLGLPEITVGVL